MTINDALAIACGRCGEIIEAGPGGPVLEKCGVGLSVTIGYHGSSPS